MRVSRVARCLPRGIARTVTIRSAVSPMDVQSRGIGARLLAPVHERADAERVPCYLETPFARTHPFYERLGYRVQEELKPLATTDAPLWTMLREPLGG